MENISHNTGLLSAIGRKLAEILDGHSAGELASYVCLSFVAGLITDTAVGGSILIHLLNWRHGLLPTFGIVSFVVFNHRWLWSFVPSLKTVGDRAKGDTIEGIPTVELLDHLFTARSLKVKEVTAKFRVPQYRVEELIKNLKRVSVLVPGANNASVLNSEFSRQDVAAILTVSNAKDLEPLFRKDSLGFTSRPSAIEIQERVDDALTPLPRAPGFVTRNLASVC